eukprot:1157597-Pelagomonas_calceolata.AAC.1
MDIFYVAGTVEQAEQPNYLAEGQSHCDLVTFPQTGRKIKVLLAVVASVLRMAKKRQCKELMPSSLLELSSKPSSRNT